MRAAIGTLLAALFLGAMFYVTLAESSVECNVCLEYAGRSECATVSAPDRDQAIMQAVTTVCANLTSGVTSGMKCSRTPPTSSSCSE